MVLLASCAAPAPDGTALAPTKLPIQQPTELPSPQVRTTPATPTPLPTTLILPTALPSRMPPTSTSMPPVTMEVLPIYSNYLGYSRPVTVYLPGEYHNLPDKRYKVLYANDGQDLIEIMMDLHLNSLSAARQIQPIIVVAIPSNDNRLYEYGTGTVPSVDGWGTMAQAYNNYIVRELKPMVDSKYRTLKGPENNGFMGWSLGGLAAFYLVWQYPNEFGIVGTFSPSFWWRTNQNSLQELLASRVIHKLVRETGKRPGMRMWFEAGTADETNDRDRNGVIDVLQDITELMDELGKKGYKPEVDMKLVVVPGGRHELSTWAAVLPEFLRWAYPYTK